MTQPGYGEKLMERRSDGNKPSSTAPQRPVSQLQAGRRYVPPPTDNSRVVQRPTPRAQLDDPREFQVQQLRRRFSPTEKTEDSGTAFSFTMKPSDPDFPFDLESLECVLHVPFSFPHGQKPHINIKNKDMGRGFQINVERGFDRLIERLPQSTLLGVMNALNKQLEALLTEQKAETIKILPNSVRPRLSQSKARHASFPVEPSHSALRPSATYREQQMRDAEARRSSETLQLEARLGRLPLFSKSLDGIAYNVPIQPRQHEDLPVPLQAVKAVKLLVPSLYPLENCRIEIQGVARDAAKKTERNFERRAKHSNEATLMGHVNYLAQNMHLFATEPEPAEELPNPEPQVQELTNTPLVDQQTDSKAFLTEENDDRSHIKVIPRPPEWTVADEEESSGSNYSDSYDSGDESTDNEHESHVLEAVPEGPERGVSLSFPLLELYGIELLELTSLYVTVKCERCKETMDFENIRSASPDRLDSCKKCAAALSIGFRKELMHENSVRAGYLDLNGYFIPTCSECSSTLPAPGLVSVRGESSMALCRECHRKMTFKLPEIKFLLVSASAKANAAPPRKKVSKYTLLVHHLQVYHSTNEWCLSSQPKEKLGIVAGQELPRRGRCTHYGKSYRWFRFSCCMKVFACDKCHDEAIDHPNEHANRMICGFVGYPFPTYMDPHSSYSTRSATCLGGTYAEDIPRSGEKCAIRFIWEVTRAGKTLF
ncbi:MAG: hypothetical protein Q9195_006237 [Heterodermia aff. obscurata]